MPDYYTSKVNLFMALAPVASTANIPSKWIRESAKFIKEIEVALMELGIFNLFPPMPDALEAEQLFCDIPHVKEICKRIYGLFHNDGVDDPQAG